MSLLDDLNPQQREAVLATEGPVLVLAGAGSGKTRVVTRRVAYLIEQGIPAGNILAVTFTNKAADQMKQRVGELLASRGRTSGEPWISTFHSFCARLLRRDAPRLELRRDFAIYDEDDQTAAVKLALEQLGLDESRYSPRSLLESISHAKNHGLTPDLLAARAENDISLMTAAVFRAYEEVLRKAGALDFDDLLLRGVELLECFPAVREERSEQFRYIQVDEYQDTNRTQYELLRLLTCRQQNLCVVGDEDQSIYAWRGANVGNILHFAEDFPGARVFRLEENYRSKQNILDAASAVVARNVRRLEKTLRGTRGQGANLRFYEAPDPTGEATFVAEEIYLRQRREPSSHIAVLCRTTFQFRAFEEAFRRLGLRYRVVGGVSFYHRAEIKDLLAYARLAMNPDDDVALGRVLNRPSRGIGKATEEALRSVAQQRSISLWAALPIAIQSHGASRAAEPLRRFRELIEDLRAELEDLPAEEFLRLVPERTGYLDYLKLQDTVQDTARTENVRELVNAAAEGAARGETLVDILDRAALVSDADDYDERTPVSLMTLHSAKGLEFEHVFLAGLEEGLFPHSRALREGDVEEERRLCYVGMTRAKQTLTLTRAQFRRSYGNEWRESSAPSCFLFEVPGELIETVPGSLAEAGERRRYVPEAEFRARSFRRPRRSTGLRHRAPDPLLGVRVRHPTYGVGTIIEVEGEGDDRKLTVSFLDHGTKKFMERYAQLERE